MEFQQQQQIKKKEKGVAYNMRYSQVINRPGTNLAQQSLTAVIGREPVFSLWCGRRIDWFMVIT